MISETDLAWLAGVFDVKYMTLQKHNSHGKKLSLFVQERDFTIIQRISDLTGSNVHPRVGVLEMKEFMRRSCSEHCKDKHLTYEASPVRHEWKNSGISSAIVLYNVMPYMLHRQDLGLEQMVWETIATTRYTGSGSNTPVTNIRKLARLGWELPGDLMDHVLPVE